MHGQKNMTPRFCPSITSRWSSPGDMLRFIQNLWSSIRPRNQWSRFGIRPIARQLTSNLMELVGGRSGAIRQIPRRDTRVTHDLGPLWLFGLPSHEQSGRLDRGYAT